MDIFACKDHGVALMYFTPYFGGWGCLQRGRHYFSEVHFGAMWGECATHTSTGN